jgi:CubicO group peptidase (beta-lactamase class C family)
MTAITFLIGAASVAMAPQPMPPQARVAFDAHRITDVRTGGIADRATGRMVNADDPVRIASVSKLVVALGLMRLVEAGTLSLDHDVSDYLGWQLRNPAFPDVPITLRLLLSHRSSLTDDVDYIVPLGKTLKDVLADPKAWDAAHAPGTWFHYVNLNFPVVGSAMEAATGERFDQLMARLILKPMKLDACFNWATCSDARITRAVVLYHANGSVRKDDLKGVRPPCVVATDGACDLNAYVPGTNGALFSPQGGLRISMRDLAKIGQLLLNRGGGLLKPSSIATITAPQWTYDGRNGDAEGGFYCSYGLAVQQLGTRPGSCKDDLLGDGKPRIGHAGEAYGLRSGLWIDPRTRKGVAYFISAVPDEAPKGDTAYTAREEAIARGQ